MLAVINANIVLLNSIIYDGTLLVDDGKILDFGEANKIIVPIDAEILDANGNYLAPGLIDIHTHAGDGVWFHDNPQKAAAFHLKHGTTSVLPATYVNMTQEQQISAVKSFKLAARQSLSKNIRGTYMEGNYINPKFGCDIASNHWIDKIVFDDYKKLLYEVSDFARVWCIAPEREGIDEFVENVRHEIPNIVFSVAHSEATPCQVEEYIEKGLRLATHHTNATGTIDKYPECRGVCVDEAVNSNDEIYAELICDSIGIHVDPYMLRLVVKTKGKSKIILVSDACVFDGPIPDGYDGVTDINFDFVGEISGSKLTLDVACHNMMKHTGCGLCDIFNYASYNPAKLLNMERRGSIKKGNIADLIIVDHRMNVQHVILEGEPIK